MNNKYQKILINLAKKALKTNNVPISSIIVKNNKIIAKAYNKKESSNIATAHAEILAINKACKKTHNWRLNDCILYTSLEPCDMCEAAIKEARIKKIYYIQKSKYYKNNTSNIFKEQLTDDYNYLNILNNFFNNKRK